MRCSYERCSPPLFIDKLVMGNPGLLLCVATTFSRGNKVWLLPGQYHPWRCSWVTSVLFCWIQTALVAQTSGWGTTGSTCDPQRIHIKLQYCFCFIDFSFLFFNLILYLFSFPQVAQWPEKEEKEQPMFGEEYDWWVNGYSFSPHICTEELFSWFDPFINRWQTFLFCFGFFFLIHALFCKNTADLCTLQT